jgi:hypothetical protein
LSNYAQCLSDAGKDEEALDHARQALMMQKRLNEKGPNRFEEALLMSAFQTRLLSWLAGKDYEGDGVDLKHILSLMPVQAKGIMLLFEGFVEGCRETEHLKRIDAFQGVLSQWEELSVAQKNNARDCWLCAAVYCASGETQVQKDHWEDNWRQFGHERQGRIPAWMLKFARRLGFEWPAFHI